MSITDKLNKLMLIGLASLLAIGCNKDSEVISKLNKDSYRKSSFAYRNPGRVNNYSFIGGFGGKNVDVIYIEFDGFPLVYNGKDAKLIPDVSDIVTGDSITVDAEGYITKVNKRYTLHRLDSIYFFILPLYQKR